MPAGTCQRIVLHDRQSFSERGADGGPGLLAALRAFLREFPEWSVVYHTPANHGLTVISRDPRDKPALPDRITMAAKSAGCRRSTVFLWLVFSPEKMQFGSS